MDEAFLDALCRKPAFGLRQEAYAGAAVPCTAVQVPRPLPVPGCSVIVDPWVYAP